MRFGIIGSGRMASVLGKALIRRSGIEVALAGSRPGRAERLAAEIGATAVDGPAELVREGIGETLTYYAFPDKHHRQIRTNNPLERLMREIRRRSRVVGCFPDGRSALMLAAARLRYIAATKWGTRRYMNMDRLKELKQERQEAACLSA